MWLRAAGPAQRADREVGSARPSVSSPDAERAERILASMAMDTFQVFEHLSRAHARDLSLEKVAEDVTRDCILKTLGEARQEALEHAAERARDFARDCLRAYEGLDAGHQRVVVKCVAELFEHFATRLERESADADRR